MGLARRWGTKGSGLGLLQYVAMDADISFECYCQLEEVSGVSSNYESLVSFYVSKEEVFHASSSINQEQQPEKRCKAARLQGVAMIQPDCPNRNVKQIKCNVSRWIPFTNL